MAKSTFAHVTPTESTTAINTYYKHGAPTEQKYQ
jgi:hypothetical protein